MEETCCTAAQFAVIGISPESVLAAFTFGFSSIGLFWFIGYCYAGAREAIKNIG